MDRELVRQFIADGGTSGNRASVVTSVLNAAERGVCEASVLLGYWYQTGFGVVQDRRSAEKYYKRAVKLGSGIAACNLADMIEEDGRHEEAEAYFRQALSAVPEAGPRLEALRQRRES